MQVDAPRPPTPEEWAQLGYRDVVELQEGKQSRVFSATSEHGASAVKLTDARLAELETMKRRAAFVADLARLTPAVAEPMPVLGEPVLRLGDWLVTATAFVSGEPLDSSEPADAAAMGASLAALHEAMRRVPARALPAISALEAVGAGRPDRSSPPQPLHGDFNTTNLRRTPAGLRVFDFDDCGMGPIEYDVANALYMVLFDSHVNEGSTHRIDAFRTPFVAAYRDNAGRSVTDDVLDEFIGLRVRALAHWVTDPASAPIGIRTSSSEWLELLRAFVNRWDHEAG